MQPGVDEAIQHHEVNAAQATQMRHATDMFRHLQVPQRRALVELMEAEQRLGRHPVPPAAPHHAQSA